MDGRHSLPCWRPPATVKGGPTALTPRAKERTRPLSVLFTFEQSLPGLGCGAYRSVLSTAHKGHSLSGRQTCGRVRCKNSTYQPEALPQLWIGAACHFFPPANLIFEGAAPRAFRRFQLSSPATPPRPPGRPPPRILTASLRSRPSMPHARGAVVM